MAKTKKTLADFTDQQPILAYELEIFDTSSNTNKFWRCYVYAPGGGGSDYHVARHWGRNGTKGQQLVESYYSKYDALDAANKVGGEKLRSGYKKEASPLDKIIREV